MRLIYLEGPSTERQYRQREDIFMIRPIPESPAMAV